MRKHCTFSVAIFATLITCCQAVAMPRASFTKKGPMAAQAALTSLPNGIALHAGDLYEEITALRDDVLRIRIVRGSRLPEDVSWAVLPDPRRGSVAVTKEMSKDLDGFRTRSLIVALDRKTLELTIRNLQGEILQQDARPVRFDGDAFRIYKTMPLDEH